MGGTEYDCRAKALKPGVNDCERERRTSQDGLGVGAGAHTGERHDLPPTTRSTILS